MMLLYRTAPVRLSLQVLVVLAVLGATHVSPCQDMAALFLHGRTDSFCSAGKTVAVDRYDPRMPGRHPAVIVLHGFDGMTRHGKLYHRAGRLLAANGYVAILVHYFDGTNGAPPSRDQINPKDFLTWVRNTHDAITYAERLPNVDPERIGVVGFSLGAFVALSVVPQDPRVDMLVEFAGAMPKQFARKARKMPPTLVIHGTADDVVPLNEAYKLDRMLTRMRTPHVVHIYPGQGHIFDKPGQKDLTRRIRAFIEYNLPSH